MSRGYFDFFALLVLLALCSINQVSAIKCVVCDSNINIECAGSANYTKFVTECLHHSFVPTSENNQENHMGGVAFDCGYIDGISTITNGTRVIRGCAVKSMTCDAYMRMYSANHHIDVHKCNRCGTDLCNSSGHLSTGIWSLSLSLIALYFIKL